MYSQDKVAHVMYGPGDFDLALCSNSPFDRRPSA